MVIVKILVLCGEHNDILDKKPPVFKLHLNKRSALLTFDLNIKSLKHLKCTCSNVATIELLYDCLITEC